MDRFLKLKIHHNGESIDLELSVYEGWLVDDLKADVDKWSYFELIGVLKELCRDFETIYYKDPTFWMNVLVDNKGALEIADLYRTHQSVDIYIQYILSQTDYYDDVVDNVEEGPDNIVDA